MWFEIFGCNEHIEVHHTSKHESDNDYLWMVVKETFFYMDFIIIEDI